MKKFSLYFLILNAAFTLGNAQVVFNSIPSRIIGQPSLQQQGTITMVAPNLVEGRELFAPESVAVDTSSSPPILYVADTNNNRVLAWQNATSVGTGSFATLVIGQRDLFSTTPLGPSVQNSTLSTGLSLPLAVAVDSSGNLYVADGGNNRILRYPKPLSQTGALLAVDLIIGQTGLTGSTPNQGLANPNASTLFFANSSGTLRTGMAFDTQGNLWVSDPGNNRVLRFPVSSLTPNNNNPAADTVLGQATFTSRALPTSPTVIQKNFLAQPSGLAFDPAGNLFVADAGYRVSVFTPPFSSGQNSSRIMGVVVPTASNPTPPTISAQTLGNSTVSPGAPPEGVFFVGSTPYVVDTGNARILVYAPFSQWPAEATQFSPSAIAVIGQPDFVSNKSNQGMPQPSQSTFSGPQNAHNGTEANGVVAATFANGNLYVVDSGNNRVLVFPQSNGSFTSATTVLGQVNFTANSINLIEGREFYAQNQGGAVAVDPSSNHLYVSDPGNNRILAFADYRKVSAGVKADLVIGQPDFYTAEINWPTNSTTQPGNQGLFQPEGIAVDSNGNLWVADTGNGRVLRFAQPFSQPGGAPPQANLVLGQASFYQTIPDASAQTMKTPYGIAFTQAGHVVVSDPGFDRILYFMKPGGGDFTNGQLATGVIGQPNFGPASEATLSSPSLISIDTDDRLYVADSGNNRIAIYPNVPTSGNDPMPVLSIPNLNKPYAVTVNQQTGEFWESDLGSNHLYRYPRFDVLISNPQSNSTITSFGPLGVGLDPFGNPIVLESINRVAFYYPAIDYTSSAGGVADRSSGNAANYFQFFAPGMLASIFAFPTSQFGSVIAGATSTPLPTTLGDIQVTVNGVLAPLLYAGPGQINFQVPSATPVSTTPTEFEVVRASTGQILASYLFRIDSVAPGLFTANSTGSGQLLAVNQDGTVNSGVNPAKAGSYISFYGTGVGPVPGGPPDGTPNPNSPVPTPNMPVVYINGTRLTPSQVQYSGLAPGFIGLWQINAQIPTNVPTAGVAVPVVITYNGITTLPLAGQNGPNGTIVTTIRTTP